MGTAGYMDKDGKFTPYAEPAGKAEERASTEKIELAKVAQQEATERTRIALAYRVPEYREVEGGLEILQGVDAKGNPKYRYVRNTDSDYAALLAAFAAIRGGQGTAPAGAGTGEIPTLTPEQARAAAPGTRYKGTDGKIRTR